jgi:hypothetical protein
MTGTQQLLSLFGVQQLETDRARVPAKLLQCVVAQWSVKLRLCSLARVLGS